MNYMFRNLLTNFPVKITPKILGEYLGSRRCFVLFFKVRNTEVCLRMGMNL